MMIEIEGLRFSYDGAPVLSGLSLSAGEGELVGIVGPNGCGKTTLFRLITGVIRPSAGRVRVNGDFFDTLSARQRARLVAAVPQDPAIPAGFTVLDLVLLGRNPHLRLLEWEGPDDLEIAVRSMEMTEVAHLADRHLSRISGGERQRATIAMALAQESPVLLLDEPTSNLDLAHQSNVLRLVRDLCRRRGGSVLVAMHDLILAAQFCDRLVMLAEGRSYADGTPADVLTVENIRAVYGVDVVVSRHPQNDIPVVLPAVSERSDGESSRTTTSVFGGRREDDS